MLSRATLLGGIAVWLLGGALAWGAVYNLKVVTDASPDYSDMESMVRSITGRWETDAQKMWALFYWDHIARRQTTPIERHGIALTDPIMQYNDYGYAMCSTISGMKCSVWDYMGYPARYYDIAAHTVPEVWYDGKWHLYDNSLSVYYTLCDGKTVAGVRDIGKTLSCPASGGKAEAGHIAIYHAVAGTGPDGYLQGADTMRDLRHLGEDTFKPTVLKYRWYFSDQERGHRYILNLRDNESYARYYARQDTDSSDAIPIKSKRTPEYKADPAYFVPTKPAAEGQTPYDTEAINARYRLRGNGIRTFKPALDEAHLPAAAYSLRNIKAQGSAIQPAAAGEPGDAVFKIEGANVLTGLNVDADFALGSATDQAVLSVSTDNGVNWKEIWKSQAPGTAQARLKLVDPVNGGYDALVKVTLTGGARMTHVEFRAITALNAKTQPQLNLGKNTVYVGAGEQSESIVLNPELAGDKYKQYAVQEQGVRARKTNPGYQGTLGAIQQQGQKEVPSGFVVFRIDAPRDVVRITQGARMYVKFRDSEIGFEHSFDEGKTWTRSYTFKDATAPFDDIHHQVTQKIPPGTRSVLFKYTFTNAEVFSVRMEVNHKPPTAGNGPVEVTFDWRERQKDYSLVARSHTQLVEKFPATYTIDVGGYDHPVVDGLVVSAKGARPDVKYGYSDGKDVGGEKFVGTWATYGTDLARGKPYTVSVPSETRFKAGDPDGKKLTDGVVGSSYGGGNAYTLGPLYAAGKSPEVVVDLGAPMKAAAFRIHIHGYPGLDAMRGQIKDKVEVLTSLDGAQYTSQGFFDFDLYWKDIPVNYMWTDEETFRAHNFLLIAGKPVEARYVKFAIAVARGYLGVTEVQVLDSVKLEPFDLKLALPDPADNGAFPPPAGRSPKARQWQPTELPDDVGKPL